MNYLRNIRKKITKERGKIFIQMADNNTHMQAETQSPTQHVPPNWTHFQKLPLPFLQECTQGAGTQTWYVLNHMELRMESTVMQELEKHTGSKPAE